MVVRWVSNLPVEDGEEYPCLARVQQDVGVLRVTVRGDNINQKHDI